jgi:UPF0271 protein
MNQIDLNSDVGELPERIADGTEARIMQWVSSVNVSCGAHAGDEATILATLKMAKKHGVSVGAHPSYPDRAGFGRTVLQMPLGDLVDSIATQLRYLAGLAKQVGVDLQHVKPHGALYNAATDDTALAEAICEGVSRLSRQIPLVGMAATPMIDVFKSRGFSVISEAFIDRRYEKNARLRSRALAGALLADPDEALAQAMSIAKDYRVKTHDGVWIPLEAQTLCIHGDTPGADELARRVFESLQAEGVVIKKIRRNPILP